MLAAAASALVVLSAAYVGDLNAAVRAAFPIHIRYVAGGLTAAAIVTLLAVAAARRREDRWRRFAALAAALGGAALHIAAFRTGDAEVDFVEAFHFVEYGLLAVLFYRTWKHHADVRRVVYPVLAGASVGIADELFQWHLASRVGELHDVGLDVAAVCCGLLVALALDPRGVRPADRGAAASRRGAGLVRPAIPVVALLLLFVILVHRGYDIVDAEIGTFRSRFDAQTLRRLAADRRVAWAEGLPQNQGRFAREDHYLTEALWHVRARNEAVDAGDAFTAWRENRIVEVYFAPLLESAVLAPGFRWSEEQRAAIAAAAARHHAAPYVSRAHTLPIYAFRSYLDAP